MQDRKKPFRTKALRPKRNEQNSKYHDRSESQPKQSKSGRFEPKQNALCKKLNLDCFKNKLRKNLICSWSIVDVTLLQMCMLMVLLHNGGFWNNCLQNSACTYSCISKQMNYKTPPFHKTAIWKVWKFMKTTSLCFAWKKSNFLAILY